MKPRSVYPLRHRRVRVVRAAGAAIALITFLGTIAQNVQDAGAGTAAPPRREAFDVFKALAGRSPSTIGGVALPGTHPLAHWAMSSVTPSWLPGDTVAVINVADSTLPLTWRMSPEFPERSAKWLRDAEQVATGYYVLGMHARALEWLHVIGRSAPAGRTAAHVRHLLLHYYVTHADTAGVDALARTLTSRQVAVPDGAEAAWAVLAGLYLCGHVEEAATAAARVESLRPASDFFRALVRIEGGDDAGARDLISRFLSNAAKASPPFPTGLVEAALLTAADLDWKTGMDGVAGREYAALASSRQPYVATWSRFMLASISMYGDEYEVARDQFQTLCESPGSGMWKRVSCALRQQALYMIEHSHGEGAR